MFRNPLATNASRPPAFNPSSTIRGIRVPTPSMPGTSNAPSYTPAAANRIESQIQANLATDRSLTSMMSAINAIDQYAPNAAFASKYRNEALQMAQQGLKQNASTPLPWIATAKLSAQVGNDALFRQTTSEFVQKFPNNPHAQYFKGLQSLMDEDWQSAEIALRNAKALGLSDESIAQMLKVAIDNQKWVWEYAEITFWIIMVWLIGLVAIYLLGLLLSRFTLKAIEQDQLDARSFATRLIRRVYRAVVTVAGVYYYISLPVILVCAVALPLTIGYAALSTPYLNLILLAVILIGGVGGVITAVSGIRTAMIRVPESQDGMQLRQGESPEFWNLVRDVAETMGTRSVDEIWISPGTDLAVTERGRWWDKLRDKGRRVLIFGVALLDDFKVDSLRAILAHEYTHFRNRDTAGGDVALKVQFAMHQFADAISERGKIRWWDITIHFLRTFHYLFTRLTLGASRLQEVLADRAAVETYGSSAFVDGLKHVIRRDIEFDHIVSGAIGDKIKSDLAPSHFYAPKPQINAFDQREIDGIIRGIMCRKTTVYDSHPAPIERLALAQRWKSASRSDSGLAIELFDQSGAPVRDEMSTLLADFAEKRAESVLEFNRVIIDVMTDLIKQGDLDARLQRAQVYYEIAEYEKSLADINVVMKQANQPPEVRYFRAAVQQSAGNHEESIADLREILKRSRSQPQDFACSVACSLGRQLWQLGRLKEAGDAMDQAIGFDPERFEAVNSRIEIARQLGADGSDEITKLKASASKLWPPIEPQQGGTQKLDTDNRQAMSSWLVAQTVAGLAAIFVLLIGGGLYAASGMVMASLDRGQPVVVPIEKSAVSGKPETTQTDPSASVVESNEDEPDGNAHALKSVAAATSEGSVPSPQKTPATTPLKPVVAVTFDQVGDNLRTIADAVQRCIDRGFYRDTAVRTDDKLSWRVHLLPFLGEEALYAEFKLDEPWDSEHNKRLLDRMPAVYRFGTDADSTRIRSIWRQGVGAQMPDIGNGVFFSDGSEQTAVILFAGEGAKVEWTRPEAKPMVDDEVASGFLISSTTPTIAVMGTGDVHSFPDGIHPLKLQALISIAGNEHVSERWFAADTATKRPPNGFKLGTAPSDVVRESKEPTRPMVGRFNWIGSKLRELKLPPGSQLSWRVHLLPLIGYQSLYRDFKLDEPWDSVHNYALIKKIPEVYTLGSRPGRTRIRAIEPVIRALRSDAPHLENKLAIVFAPTHQEVTWTRPEPLPTLIRMPKARGMLVSGKTVSFDMPSPVNPECMSLIDPAVENQWAVKIWSESDLVATNRRAPRYHRPVMIRGDIALPDPVPAVPAAGATKKPYYTIVAESSLARISRALQQYTSNYRTFPKVQSATSGNTLKLSWRVELLPFLGHQTLYDRFDHDQPWDADANLALLDEMPEVYRTQNGEKSRTQICMFIGRGMCLSNERIRDSLVSKDMPITDSRASTILGGMVGTDKAVPWTKPVDIEVDPENLVQSLGKVGKSVGLITGTGCQIFPSSLSPEIFHALATSTGDEFVDAPTLMRYSAHVNGYPYVGEDQARLFEAYGMRVVLSCLVQKYQRNPELLDDRNLSWRVHILSSLDYLHLYKQFRLDQPWDSPHNLKLIPYMPDIFRDADASSSSTTTRLMTIRGVGAVSNPYLPSTPYQAISDGPDKTLLMIQTPKGHEVTWTKPDDFPFLIDDPMNGLENIPIAKGLTVGFADGQINFLRSAITPDAFKSLVTPRGGERVIVAEQVMR
ncbi:DUF1559 domain-containing protein [Stieleria sp. ICT_E10.1]|nr:DUF1559 domain-containing protein [Stieleria sedimenti]